MLSEQLQSKLDTQNRDAVRWWQSELRVAFEQADDSTPNTVEMTSSGSTDLRSSIDPGERIRDFSFKVWEKGKIVSHFSLELFAAKGVQAPRVRLKEYGGAGEVLEEEAYKAFPLSVFSRLKGLTSGS